MSNPNKVQPERPIEDDPDNPTTTKTLGLDELQLAKQPGDRETVQEQRLEQQANSAARTERNVAETAQNEPKPDLALTTAFHLSNSAIEQSEATMNARKAAVTDLNHTIVDPAIIVDSGFESIPKQASGIQNSGSSLKDDQNVK